VLDAEMQALYKYSFIAQPDENIYPAYDGKRDKVQAIGIIQAVRPGMLVHGKVAGLCRR